MTEKERFICALKRIPFKGKVPTFELVFFLTMEKIGKVHPSHRAYHQWGQMSVRERELQLRDIAFCYTEIARLYGHSAIFVHPNPYETDAIIRLLEIIQETTGGQYFITMHGDTTLPIPDGTNMMDFSARIYEDADGIIREQENNLHNMLELTDKILRKDPSLLTGYTLCSDYCFNVNPFYPPDIFSRLIAPTLEKTTRAYHDRGLYVIKHTDGNIMPIIGQLVECGVDALHSLDPQGGVDLANVKKMYGSSVALIGNVNCGLLQTGTREEVETDVRRSLRQGMEGGAGYVFSTSNCVYTGLMLERYELMMDIWKKEGIYV